MARAGWRGRRNRHAIVAWWQEVGVGGRDSGLRIVEVSDASLRRRMVVVDRPEYFRLGSGIDRRNENAPPSRYFAALAPLADPARTCDEIAILVRPLRRQILQLPPIFFTQRILPPPALSLALSLSNTPDSTPRKRYCLFKLLQSSTLSRTRLCISSASAENGNRLDPRRRRKALRENLRERHRVERAHSNPPFSVEAGTLPRRSMRVRG